MFERFTDRARKTLALANQEAQRLNHEYIGTEHILLGLVKEGSGVGANILKNLDVDLRKVQIEVEKLVKSGPNMTTLGKLPQTPQAKKVIQYAIEEARNLNHNYVGTEHVLLGLLREQDGVAAQVLMNLNLKLDNVREEILNLLGVDTEAAEEDDSPIVARLTIPEILAHEIREQVGAGADVLAIGQWLKDHSSSDLAIAHGCLTRVQDYRTRIEEITTKKDECVKGREYEKAAKLRDEVEGIRSQLKRFRDMLRTIF